MAIENSLPPKGEFAHIEWIRSRVAAHRMVAVGPGDDTAVLRTPPDLLATTDMLLEGVHFSFEEATPEQVGRKAMNVNLSDIAAMAGKPLFALVAAGLPAGSADSLGRELFVGLQAAAEKFGVAIVGGDTNRSPAGVVIAVTVLGVPTGGGPVLRSGAKPGDVICVTGKLGYSREGKHLHFTPRIAEAQLLHARYTINAMMDLSDGLGGDLFRILNESGVGAVIDLEALPIVEGSTADRAPYDHALNDGEDFELLFTMPKTEAERLIADRPLAELGVEVTRIGEITAEREARLRTAAGMWPLRRGGFVHGC